MCSGSAGTRCVWACRRFLSSPAVDYEVSAKANVTNANDAMRVVSVNVESPWGQ